MTVIVFNDGAEQGIAGKRLSVTHSMDFHPFNDILTVCLTGNSMAKTEIPLAT